jgi:transposase
MQRYIRIDKLAPQKMTLSLDKRYEIVFLHEHPQGPKWSFAKIGKHIHCTKSTAAYWVEKYHQNVDLNDEQKSGRPRSTSMAQDQRIVKLAKKEHDITSNEIQQKLEKKGVEISSRTVRRRLVEAGGKYSQEIPKPLLSEKHRIKRLQWARKHQNFNWDHVIFTDESSFQLFQSNRKVWQFIKKRKVFRTVKHPPKVHVWGCFSSQGFGKLICFQQNLNAHFMCSIYERGLLASAYEFFDEEDIEWILQEDNDPKHRSKIAKKWKAEHGIIELPWPSMSPDQNPIENVWRLVKIKISKKKIKTIKGLKGEIVKEWNRLPDQLAENLVSSMRRRIEALIEAGGDYTMY